jgi:membrane-bound hydrogenase subunit mbhJ
MGHAPKEVDMSSPIRKSPWIYHAHAGGCVGCDIELLACMGPRYDLERLGVKWVASPRYADILLVTGCVPLHTKPFLERVYAQTPEPKRVIAMGACGCSCGVFIDEENYSIAGPVDRIIPVDVKIPGCPPKPEAIIDGIIKVMRKF